MFILIVVVFTLVKNISMIKKNPLQYGLQVNNFNYCNCYDNNSKVWFVNDSTIQSQQNNFIPSIK